MKKNPPRTIFGLAIIIGLALLPALANALDLSAVEQSISPESDFVEGSDINDLGSIQNIICSGMSPSEMANCMVQLQDGNIIEPQGFNSEASSNPSNNSSGDSGSSSGTSSGSGNSSNGESSTSTSTSSSSDSSNESTATSSTPATSSSITTPVVTSTEASSTETPASEVVPAVQPSTVVELAPAVSNPTPVVSSSNIQGSSATKTTRHSSKVTTATVVEAEKLSPAAPESSSVQTSPTNYQANLLLAVPIAKASQVPAILTSLFLIFLALQGGIYAFYIVRNRR